MDIIATYGTGIGYFETTKIYVPESDMDLVKCCETFRSEYPLKVENIISVPNLYYIAHFYTDINGLEEFSISSDNESERFFNSAEELADCLKEIIPDDFVQVF